MTALTVSKASRLLQSHPIATNSAIPMLHKFQTFVRFHASNRGPEANIRSEINDDGLPKDYRLQVYKMSSRRLDALVCKAIGQGRKFVFLQSFSLLFMKMSDSDIRLDHSFDYLIISMIQLQIFCERNVGASIKKQKLKLVLKCSEIN